jgi:ElaB/YqjD/DUF883 family membrane-anchored ribosome-binding protein
MATPPPFGQPGAGPDPRDEALREIETVAEDHVFISAERELHSVEFAAVQAHRTRNGIPAEDETDLAVGDLEEDLQTVVAATNELLQEAGQLARKLSAAEDLARDGQVRMSDTSPEEMQRVGDLLREVSGRDGDAYDAWLAQMGNEDPDVFRQLLQDVKGWVARLSAIKDQLSAYKRGEFPGN